MNASLQKGPYAVDDDHQDVGLGEAVQVDQKVPGQLLIFQIIYAVIGEGAEKYDEKYYLNGGYQRLRCEVKAKGSVKSPKC